ncbi:alpha/beta fold hydrolase [Bordetella genomosp. 13]|uniref:alpha/beta fold hydrolase n=1 Tax=Bordetella genomosp. 13 TaxID=463040 RepID=UPI0011AB256F|nr:alpha/beta hydrolase [Bordetella genomosp. 13]
MQDNKELARTRITIPVLAIGGGGHGGLGEFQGEQMRRYATNVTASVLEGCGHWLPEECARPLDDAVVGFLAAP